MNGMDFGPRNLKFGCPNSLMIRCLDILVGDYGSAQGSIVNFRLDPTNELPIASDLVINGFDQALTRTVGDTSPRNYASIA